MEAVVSFFSVLRLVFHGSFYRYVVNRFDQNQSLLILPLHSFTSGRDSDASDKNFSKQLRTRGIC